MCFADDATTTSGVLVNQLRPRLLNEELQLYFTRITSALQRGGSTPASRQQLDTAIKSISQDAWLQELVPFFVNYVSRSLYKHIGDPEHCRNLVRMAHALLVNPHLHLELHVSWLQINEWNFLCRIKIFYIKWCAHVFMKFPSSCSYTNFCLPY
jgi:hypothetical protein